MRIQSAALALFCAGLPGFPGAPALAQGPGGIGTRYERVGSREFHRVDARGRARLNPDVVSVSFAPEVGDFEGFRAAVRAERGLADLRGLRRLRENRLGVCDLALEGRDLLETLEKLEASGLVTLCEPAGYGRFSELPDDPLFPDQHHLTHTGSPVGTADSDVDGDLAWNLETGDASVLVGVLDSGTQVDHPDMPGAHWINPGEIPGNGLDDDANGFVDDVNGWNFELSSNAVQDTSVHGTPVAGIIAARANNGVGVAGVAGGFGDLPGVQVLTVKVGTNLIPADIIDDAIVYATDQGARILCMAFEVPQSAAIDMAIDYAVSQGVLLIAASGNSNSSIDYPAVDPDVLAIAGTDRDDEHWAPNGFIGSNIGPDNWVAAPAEVIWSTVPNSTYGGFTGTSFSCAIVSGVAALLYSAMPSLGADDVKEILRITADDVVLPGFDVFSGWGRVNAYSAVLHVLQNDCNGNGLYDPTEIADGLVPDSDGDGVPDDCDHRAYCFAGTANACVACPCGNAAPDGALAGCENADGSSCALLASGSPSLSADTLELVVEGARASTTAVLCSGDNALPLTGACPGGSGITSSLLEGLRCVGGSLLRHGTRATDATGECAWTGLTAGFAAGQERQFQVFYLDDAASGCGTGVNTSNAVSVEFRP